MRYKTISYQALKNLGNYESERLEMTVELEQEDAVDPDSAVLALKRRVNAMLAAPLIIGKPEEDPPIGEEEDPIGF